MPLPCATFLLDFNCVYLYFRRRFDDMVCFFRDRYSGHIRRGSATILAFVLCSGFLIGSIFPMLTENNSLSMMRTAAQCRVSIVTLFSVLILPFLFSSFAVMIHQVWLLLPIGFMKAFLFGFASSSVLCLFGSPGWLICLFLLFSDYLSLPVLCWFWIRVLDPNFRSVTRSLVPLVPLLFGIVFIDVHYVSPFLVDLLS